MLSKGVKAIQKEGEIIQNPSKMLPKSIPGGTQAHFGLKAGPGYGKGVVLTILGAKKGGFWESRRTLFHFRPSRTQKKWDPRGHSRKTHFGIDFLGFPKGPQEGSRVHGSSIFTFAAEAEKA